MDEIYFGGGGIPTDHDGQYDWSIMSRNTHQTAESRHALETVMTALQLSYLLRAFSRPLSNIAFLSILG